MTIGVLGLLPIRTSAFESTCTVENRQTEPCQKLVQIHLEVGDRFQAQEEYYEARKDYLRALELDPLNVDAHKRLISLYLTVGPSKMHDKGLYLTEDYQRLLYRLYTIEPSLKDDPEMLMAESRMLADDRLPYHTWNAKGAERILTRLHDLKPNDPDLMVKLGILRVNLNRSPEEAQGASNYSSRQ